MVLAMPKKQQEYNICPKCGTRVTPSRTWQLIAPIPDSQGRVTITIMGSYECPNCGYRWRGVVSKMKVGGGSVEIEGGRGKSLKLQEVEGVHREGEVIELTLDDIMAEEE